MVPEYKPPNLSEFCPKSVQKWWLTAVSIAYTLHQPDPYVTGETVVPVAHSLVATLIYCGLSTCKEEIKMKRRAILWQMGIVMLIGMTAVFTFTQQAQTQNTQVDSSTVYNQENHSTGSNSWQCWNEVTPELCHVSLSDVFMLTEDDGWAVGAYGTALHWNGSQWQTFPTPTSEYLTAVQMSSNDDGWAVDNNGAILHWDGAAWSAATSPITQSLQALTVLSATNAWAVGGTFSEGMIVHWDGNNWLEVATPPVGLLRGIDMVSPSDGWAVGTTTGGDSAILHWDGIVWSEVSHPTTFFLTDIDMIAANDGWAVGSSLLHWDGASWTAVTSMFGGASISMVSADNGWAVGGQFEIPVIKHWDGNAWNDVDSPVQTDLYAVNMITENDGWIVGRDGVMMRWNGNEWVVVNSLPPTAGHLQAIKMVSPASGWAVGGGGFTNSADIFQWNGVSWTAVTPLTTNSLNAVDATATNDAWAVGYNGVILHWDGADWTAVSSPTTRELLDIDILTPTDGWAAGRYGVILHWDGSSWTEIASPTGVDLYDVAMITADDGWAVGWTFYTEPLAAPNDREKEMADNSQSNFEINAYYSVILHWDGSAWTEFTTISGEQLEAIDMVSPTDGWAVGWSEVAPYDYEGKIRHWNGTTWASTPVTATTQLHDITMNTAVDGWIVGDNTILHWDGQNWLESESPAPARLLAIAMLSPDYGWAVGRNGVIFRYGEPDIPPEQLTLIGPITGTVGINHTFTTTVTPITTTIPLTYVWSATGQATITQTNNLSDTVSFLWDTVGNKTVTVTASNTMGAVTTTVNIPIYDVGMTGRRVYLPVVLRP